MTTELAMCVGGLVIQDGKILLVRQTYGEGLAGKWTVPWGYAYDPKTGVTEAPNEAVLREVREEAGVEARVRALIGLQNYRTRRGERQIRSIPYIYVSTSVGSQHLITGKPMPPLFSPLLKLT